jgi:hypothetical protein
MGIIDRDQVAADWAKRGFSCDLWTDSPGRRWTIWSNTLNSSITGADLELGYYEPANSTAMTIRLPSVIEDELV